MVQKVTTIRFQRFMYPLPFDHFPPLCQKMSCSRLNPQGNNKWGRTAEIFCVLLTSLMPRRTDIPLRFSANISTRDATTMTRSKIFQPLSKYLQKKTELSNVLYSFKGQLISKCLFEVFVWTKIPTKFLIISALKGPWQKLSKFSLVFWSKR